jgi:L-idonate 5-dehydrogenase
VIAMNDEMNEETAMSGTRACVLHAKGDIRIEEQILTEPGPNEVLVRVGAGGICGSDLHYFQDGGFGAIRVREPIILGHEVAGRIEALGSAVSHLVVGQKVALNPSRPCNVCRYCLQGLQQHCLDMRFMGSAMRMPHVQGAFRERMIVDAFQCVPVDDGLSLNEAAMAEPLAVVLHALNQAGNIAGRRVIVTGAGPIGLLALLAARHAGAAEVAMTDIADEPLALARKLGASATVNVAASRDGLDRFAGDKGHFDVCFECSGAGPALDAAIMVVRPRGTIVRVGIGDTRDINLNLLVSKEIRLCGSFRFHSEFALAAELLSTRRIDVRPLITATYPLSDAVKAFDEAGDKRRSIKVQLVFDEA